MGSSRLRSRALNSKSSALTRPTSERNDDLERHIYLRALQDTNEVLFYKLLLDHIKEMTPIVYTPVVALACQQFSHIYRRPRGLFISYPLVASLLRSRPNPDADVIVVTDGEPSWASVTKAQAASAFRSANYPYIRSSVAFVRNARSPSFWMGEPTTRNVLTILSTSAGVTSALRDKRTSISSISSFAR